MTRLFRLALLTGLCSLLFVPVPASAQTTVGVKGGVSFSTVDFKVDGIDDRFLPDFQRRPGGVGGVFVGRDFQNRFGLQVEALFVQKATEAEEFDIEGQPLDTEFRMNYLEVPVLVRARAGSGDRAAFHVYGGPSIAFKVGESIRVAGVELDEDSGLRSYDAGLNVGASVTIRQLVIDGRYTHGLVNIEDEDADGVSVKTRTFMILVGWAFR